MKYLLSITSTKTLSVYMLFCLHYMTHFGTLVEERNFITLACVLGGDPLPENIP